MANALTLFRLLLVPIFFAMITWPGAHYDRAAFIVFGLAAVTDLVDGYVARRFNMVTEFGRLIDPFADRVLIFAAIAGLFLRDIIPMWSLVSLAVRDMTMMFGYWLGKELGKPLVPVNLFGRVTNFYLMGSIFMLLFQTAFVSWPIFIWLFYLGVILYLTSGLVYIVQEAQLLNKPAKEAVE